MKSSNQPNTLLSESITISRDDSLNCYGCKACNFGCDFVVLRLIGACMVWLSTSIALTLVLKMVLDTKQLNFCYPLSVTIFSFVVSSIILWCTSKAPAALWTEQRWSLLSQVALPLSIGTAVEITMSNIAYPLISVSLICVLKCTTLLTSFIGGVLIGVESRNPYTLLLMVILLVGIVLASTELIPTKQTSMSWQGILWMLISSFAFSFRSLVAQKVNATYCLTAMQISYIVMPGAALLLTPFALTFESSVFHWRPHEHARLTETILCVLSIPILGLINMGSLFEVVNLSSSLTMAVLVSLRQLLSIGSAVVLFHDSWSIKGSVGIIVSLLVMIEYARYRASLLQAAAQEERDVDAEADPENTPLLPDKIDVVLCCTPGLRTMASLDMLLQETKIRILQCVCADATRLPAASLRLIAQVSSEWRTLCLELDLLPFSGNLNFELLTPQQLFKRSGDVWGPEAPLEVHRTKDSEPVGEMDQLINFFRMCQRRRFEPAMELLPRLQTLTAPQLAAALKDFRNEHFSNEYFDSSAAEQHQAHGEAPPPVWGAAAFALPGKKLCVLGGGCYNFEYTNRQSAWAEVFWHNPGVFVFDVQSQIWKRQEVSGDIPPIAHTYNTAHTLLGGRWSMWCGGYYGMAYNTAYALDVDKWEWHKLRNSAVEDPCPRYFAASFEHCGALFSWGGRNTEHSYCADLWRLDPSRKLENVVRCEEIKASGDLPPAKFAATLTNCEGRFAVLFGGGVWVRGGQFKADSEVFVLNLDTFAWSHLDISGSVPTPRCQHAAVNLGGHLVVILGGYDGVKRCYMGLDDVCVLNVHSLAWMSTTGQATAPTQTDDVDAPAAEGQARHRRRNEDAEPEGSDEEDDEREQDDEDDGMTNASFNSSQDILGPSFVDASNKSGWIRGQFPAPRAGAALVAVSEDAADGKHFYVFGGAEYVHQIWYSDLYKCTVQPPSPLA